MSKIGGRGKTDGIQYWWSLEDAENNECRVKVTIDVWGISRRFPQVLSEESAKKEAADLAASLLVTIQGVR